MNKYDIMRNSINKNIEELSEYLVNVLGCKNYYDLIDVITTLCIFKELVCNVDIKLYNKLWKKAKELAK